MITTREATDALREAATTERRSAKAYSYNRSAPLLILWGLIWIVGYGGMAELPGQQSGWLWLALSVVGTGISIWLGNAGAKARGQSGWRVGALVVIAFAFTNALFSILPPTNALQVGAFTPLLLSAIYAAIGLWQGLRFVLVGAFPAAITLGAYFFLKDFFFVWMALAGGGSLLLTGLWMRNG
jgi:hypothetical protein